MAPSAYPRIPCQMALAPILGSCAAEFRQVVWQKQLRQDHTTAIMPASGGLCPSASARASAQRAPDLQLAPSTYMTLGRRNHDSAIPNETMPKQHVNPASLFPSVEHGFSQVVIASGAKTVFISGQTAWDANKQIVGRSLGEQTRQALRNVKTAVEAAGGNLRDIVALRIYIVHHAEQNVEAVAAR